PADLEDLADGPLLTGNADEVPDDVVDRDRLRARRRPARHDHRREVLHQLPGQLPRDATPADDDAGAQDRDRNAAFAEQSLDLTARAQAGRDAGLFGAEPTEEHDLPDAGLGRRLAEGPGSAGVA